MKLETDGIPSIARRKGFVFWCNQDERRYRFLATITRKYDSIQPRSRR